MTPATASGRDLAALMEKRRRHASRRVGALETT